MFLNRLTVSFSVPRTHTLLILERNTQVLCPAFRQQKTVTFGQMTGPYPSITTKRSRCLLVTACTDAFECLKVSSLAKDVSLARASQPRLWRQQRQARPLPYVITSTAHPSSKHYVPVFLDASNQDHAICSALLTRLSAKLCNSIAQGEARSST